MCSYNRINGTHACENQHTLNEILKGELNFQGSVVSDWGAAWSTANSANAGLDVTMPGSANYSTPFGPASLGDFFGSNLLNVVKNGSVPEDRLDDMVLRTLVPIIQFEQDWRTRKPTFTLGDLTEKTNNVQGDHYKIIKKIGEESATLLKNNRTDGRGMPLKPVAKGQSLAIIGEDAGRSTPISCDVLGNCDLSKNTGTLASGSGSGYTNPPYVVDPLSAIKKRFTGTLNVVLDNNNLLDIATQSRKSDSALVFVNAFMNEGVDRVNLELGKNGTEVIKTAAAHNQNTIVVIHSGEPVLMEEWIDHENITAVIFAYYPGQESGSSLAPLLFGDLSPSGKLPFTLGKKESDWPPNTIISDAEKPEAEFTEKLLLDYRWFDAKKITPRFEFGFGLSYSSFKFGKASISSSFKADSTSIQQTAEKFEKDGFKGKSVYDQIFKVEVDVTNSGKVKAAEVAQLYLEFPQSAGEPPSLLRGFEKLSLEAGKTKRAIFSIRRKDISVWSVETQRWKIPKGNYKFKIGSSSRKFETSASWNIH